MADHKKSIIVKNLQYQKNSKKLMGVIFLLFVPVTNQCKAKPVLSRNLLLFGKHFSFSKARGIKLSRISEISLFLQPRSIEQWVLSISQAHLVVVLVALLHGWIIGAIVFLCKTSKQKNFWFCNGISAVASWSCFSDHLALTQYYTICLAICLMPSNFELFFGNFEPILVLSNASAWC